jgi:hypothetical protein
MEAAPKEFNGRSLLYKPSFPDSLDIKYHDHIGLQAITDVQPVPIDLRPMLPNCFDQQQRGCCVAEGAVGMKAYQENMQDDYPANGLSVAYLYTKCKQYDGDTYNEGTEPKVAMQILQQYGICPEDIMPTSSLLNLAVPQLPSIPSSADSAAVPYRIASFAQICGVEDTNRSQLLPVVRVALQTRGVFTLALLVAENFKPDENGLLPLPEGLIRGGHQIAVVGDLPDRQALIVRNSWGTAWGLNGYAYLPYIWLTHEIDITGKGNMQWVIFEAWTSLDISGSHPPNPTPLPNPRAKQIIITPGASTMLVDDVSVALDQPAVMNNMTNRMLIPVRAMGSAAGYKVDWDGQKAVLTAN